MSNIEPKFEIYTEAIFIGDSRSGSPKPGSRVSIVASHVNEIGTHCYTICESKSSSTYTCSEHELEPAEPVPFVSDHEIRNNIVSQTADFRFSSNSIGIRELIATRGYDPMRCFQLSCDQGDDVNLTLFLSDGVLVNLDYREHPRTRQAMNISQWEILDYDDRETQLCRKILNDNSSEFDESVRKHYEDNKDSMNSALPPLEWGDRTWHTWEQPPE